MAQNVNWFNRFARHKSEHTAATSRDSTRRVSGRKLLAFDQTMDRAQMSLRVALAAHRVIHLGRVAMRFDVGGIAFQRAQETSDCVLMLLFPAIEQAEL